jgi:hypothetical protein
MNFVDLRTLGRTLRRRSKAIWPPLCFPNPKGRIAGAAPRKPITRGVIEEGADNSTITAPVAVFARVSGAISKPRAGSATATIQWHQQRSLPHRVGRYRPIGTRHRSVGSSAAPSMRPAPLSEPSTGDPSRSDARSCDQGLSVPGFPTRSLHQRCRVPVDGAAL